jgi:predicted nuclease of predicted toxin-antitoxin system
MKLLIDMKLATRLFSVLRKYQSTLEGGALITVDERTSRVRILPFDIGE